MFIVKGYITLNCCWLPAESLLTFPSASLFPCLSANDHWNYPPKTYKNKPENEIILDISPLKDQNVREKMPNF